MTKPYIVGTSRVPATADGEKMPSQPLCGQWPTVNKTSFKKSGSVEKQSPQADGTEKAANALPLSRANTAPARAAEKLFYSQSEN